MNIKFFNNDSSSLDEDFAAMKWENKESKPITPAEDLFKVTNVIKKALEIDPGNKEIWERVSDDIYTNKFIAKQDGKENTFVTGVIEHSNKVILAFNDSNETTSAVYESADHPYIISDIQSLSQRVPPDKRSLFLRNSLKLIDKSFLPIIDLRQEVLHEYISCITDNRDLPKPLPEEYKLEKPANYNMDYYEFKKINFILARIYSQVDRTTLPLSEFKLLVEQLKNDFKYNNEATILNTLCSNIVRRLKTTQKYIEEKEENFNYPKMTFENPAPVTLDEANAKLSKIKSNVLENIVGKEPKFSGYKAAYIDSTDIDGSLRAQFGDISGNKNNYEILDKNDWKNKDYFLELCKSIDTEFFRRDMEFVKYNGKYYLNSDGRNRTMSALLRGAKNIPVLYRDVEI